MPTPRFPAGWLDQLQVPNPVDPFEPADATWLLQCYRVAGPGQLHCPRCDGQRMVVVAFSGRTGEQDADGALLLTAGPPVGEYVAWVSCLHCRKGAALGLSDEQTPGWGPW